MYVNENPQCNYLFAWTTAAACPTTPSGATNTSTTANGPPPTFVSTAAGSVISLWGNATGWVFNGNAFYDTLLKAAVAIPDTSTFRVGTVFYSTPVTVCTTFSATFAFRLTGPGWLMDSCASCGDSNSNHVAIDSQPDWLQRDPHHAGRVQHPGHRRLVSEVFLFYSVLLVAC